MSTRIHAKAVAGTTSNDTSSNCESFPVHMQAALYRAQSWAALALHYLMHSQENVAPLFTYAITVFQLVLFI